MNENPYEAPVTQAPVSAQVASDDETLRRRYLKHEVSVKSISTIYWLGAAGLLFSSFSLFSMMSSMNAVQGSREGSWVFYTFPAMGALLIAAAVGIRKLKFWGRVTATVVSSVGLLGFPIGTVVNLYILFLLWNKKSKVVFSEDYKLVISKTPHVKYKTPKVVWILLLVVVLLVAAAIIWAKINSVNGY
ncbi:MAG: hypothetical protein ACSHX0_09540 [Akkermansiaceae bacterium]